MVLCRVMTTELQTVIVDRSLGCSGRCILYPKMVPKTKDPSPGMKAGGLWVDFWLPGTSITVGFVEEKSVAIPEVDAKRKEVLSIANLWLAVEEKQKPLSVSFSFVEDWKNADVRINLVPDSSDSWSYVGTECTNQDIVAKPHVCWHPFCFLS